MKKILSLVLALVMIIGMLPMGAINASAAEVSATLTFDDTSKRTTGTTSQQVWEENGIVFTNDKASSTSNVNTSYFNPIRLYAKSSATVTYTGGAITKIEVTCSSDSYATTLAGSVGNEASASGSVVTIVPTAASSTYTIASVSAQVRVNSVTVYAEVSDGECAHGNTTEVAAVEASCTSLGYTAGVYCNDCYSYISGHEEIPSLGHTETSEVTAPTCTAGGYTTYTCSVCGNVRTADEVEATGHSFENGTCSLCGVTQSTSVKASSIAIGDQVIIVSEGEKGNFELNAFNGTSYAIGTAYTGAPVGSYIWTVEAGASEGTFAFAHEGAYMAWSSSNSLKTSDTVDANSSWTVSFDDEGNAIILNGADSTRKLQWNASNPRFACYTSTQTAIQIYTIAQESGEEPSEPTEPEVSEPDVSEPTTTEFEGEVDTTDPAKTITVSFSVPESVTAVESVTYAESGITLPAADAPNGYTFVGWAEAEVNNATEKPVVFGEGATYTTASTENVTLYAVYSYALEGEGTAYKLTDISNIEATDKVVITMTYSDGTIYALQNGNGTSKAPVAAIVTATNGVLDAAPEDALIWNIGGDASAYTIYPNGTTATWLYCTATNNGVRVGTNANKAFTIDAASGYLKNSATSRYVGVYRTTPDWRCYTNTTGNTANQTLGFYVESANSTTYYTSVIDSTVCIHQWNDGEVTTPAACETEGVMTYTCTLCGETKEESISALEHIYESVITSPTTESQGYTTHTCTLCGDTYTDSYINPLVEIESGTYVFHTAEGSALTAVDEAKTYGYLSATAVTVTDGVVSGHSNQNIFKVTAIGDGSYTIQDTYNRYLYMTGSFNSFNVAAEQPAEGAAWAFSTAGDGVYYITNMATAKTVGLGLKSDGTYYDTYGAYADETSGSSVALILTAVNPCAHTNTSTTTVDATCTAPGAVTETCGDCGEIISETEIPAIGHDFQDGICANCGKVDPSTIGDRYYIATIRAEGNYFYMTDDLGTAKTLRYTAVDSGLTALPTSIVAPEAGYVFVLLENEDGTYSLYAEKAGLYLGWTEGNSGILVEEEAALKLAVDKLEDGTYNIHFASGETNSDDTAVERYLSLNNTAGSDYFAWYKGTQKQNLSLVPVCEHDDPILDAAVAPTYTETGLTEGSHCGTCGAIYTAQQIVPVLENPVTGWNITLGDSIGVNFEMTLAETDTVKVYLNGEEIAFTSADGKLTVVLAAAQMTDEITIKVNDMVTSVDAYTVRKYADVILADETKADCHALVKEMLNYGAASQTFFDHTGTLANDGITVEAAEVPTEGGEVGVSGSVDGITFYGASLLHKDKIAVRFYFQADSIDGMNFTVNGETCEAVPHENGMFYVEVAGINPQNMDDDIMVMVNEELSVSYSPMDYIIRMYNKAESTVELKALVQALYGYYVAAAEYTAQ